MISRGPLIAGGSFLQNASGHKDRPIMSPVTTKHAGGNWTRGLNVPQKPAAGPIGPAAFESRSSSRDVHSSIASTGQACAPRCTASGDAPSTTFAFFVSESIAKASGAIFTHRAHPMQRSASTLASFCSSSSRTSPTCPDASHSVESACGHVAQAPVHGVSPARSVTGASTVPGPSAACNPAKTTATSARHAIAVNITRRCLLNSITHLTLNQSDPAFRTTDVADTRSHGRSSRRGDSFLREQNARCGGTFPL